MTSYDDDFPEPPELDEAGDEVPPLAAFAWNEARDAALLRLALAGGKSAAQLAEELSGRPEFDGAHIDPARIAIRVGILRAEVAPHGVTVPRLLPDRYWPDGKRLADLLKAKDRTGEV